jgi:7-cyano-7-deazaguanine reductase
MSDGFKALGSKGNRYDGLETFEAPVGVTEVTLESDEVTAVCPVTGQPDWYMVIVEYAPDLLCVESKTFKLFLQSFRNEGLFCETLAVRIRDEMLEHVRPERVKVTVRQKPRGGVSITAVSETVR